MAISKKGNLVTWNGSSIFSKNGTAERVGETLFGPDGSMMTDNGSSVLGSRGPANIISNTINTAHGTYTLIGNMLYGPNGQTWSGVSSMDEAKDIALMD
ncbi:MAG: hypothetical protein J5889_03325 [Clostridia bacterium]|nr:hypothetical protein [Clostridia bacterium]